MRAAILDAAAERVARDGDAAVEIRRWALDHPHDYALIYGTPIPGYAAPQDTVVSGTRVTRALVQIVRDAGHLAPVVDFDVDGSLVESFAALRSEIDLDASDASDATILTVVVAWSQLFGLLTFELFGQTRNFVSDDEALFRCAAAAMANMIGLPPD